MMVPKTDVLMNRGSRLTGWFEKLDSNDRIENFTLKLEAVVLFRDNFFFFFFLARFKVRTAFQSVSLQGLFETFGLFI